MNLTTYNPFATPGGMNTYKKMEAESWVIFPSLVLTNTGQLYLRKPFVLDFAFHRGQPLSATGLDCTNRELISVAYAEV